MKKTTETTKKETRKRIQYCKFAINKRLRQLLSIIIAVLGCYYIQVSLTHDVLEGTWKFGTGMIMVFGGVYLLYVITKEYRFKNCRYKKRYEHLFKKRP